MTTDMTEKEKKILYAIERTYRPGTPQSWALRRILDESGKVCDMESLQLEIDDWQEKTFPKSTMMSKFHHLVKEIPELGQAIQENKSIGEELADCQHLLFGIASKSGLNLYEETQKKFAVNKTRKWGKEDENGVVEHIREPIREVKT